MHLGHSIIKATKTIPRSSNIFVPLGFSHLRWLFEKYSKNIRYFEYALFDSSAELNRTLYDLLFKSLEYSHNPISFSTFYFLNERRGQYLADKCPFPLGYVPVCLWALCTFLHMEGLRRLLICAFSFSTLSHRDEWSRHGELPLQWCSQSFPAATLQTLRVCIPVATVRTDSQFLMTVFLFSGSTKRLIWKASVAGNLEVYVFVIPRSKHANFNWVQCQLTHNSFGSTSKVVFVKRCNWSFIESVQQGKLGFGKLCDRIPSLFPIWPNIPMYMSTMYWPDLEWVLTC